MKKTILSILILASLNSFAQKFTNANDVINKYLEVTKIKDNADKIQDMTWTLTSESPRGVAETELKFAFPFKSSLSVFANGMEIMTSKYDGEKLERKSNFGGQNQPAKIGYEALSEANKSNPFAELDYAKLKYMANLLPNETIDNIEYYVVEVKDSLNKSWKDYYNVLTGYKERNVSTFESPRGKVENTMIYDKYKTFKGSEILFASIQKRTTQMGEIVSELQSIKFNKGLKPKDFEIK